jgi:hypothetical protein
MLSWETNVEVHALRMQGWSISAIAQALLAFRGNSYSVPPGHAGQQVTVRHQLGRSTVDIVSGRGAVLPVSYAPRTAPGCWSTYQ